MNDDERLKRMFDALRADDARRAPSFDEIRRRPKRRSPWAVVVPIASAAAAAAVFVVWCNARHEAAPAATAAAGASPAASMAVAAAAPVSSDLARARVDDAPLDFLLDVPGLHGTPNFETSFRTSLRGARSAQRGGRALGGLGEQGALR
jgi:hypothetical protein